MTSPPAFLRGFVCRYALLGLCAFACRRIPDPALAQLHQARGLAASVRLGFEKGVAASDRAVMADTDEASLAFARQAEAATAEILENTKALGARLESLGDSEEASLLMEFERCFTEYRGLDHDVLALAVENTNLKAQRLSFGPVARAADAFREALESFVKASPPKERCATEVVVVRAELSVREVQVLHAPHIVAEADDVMAGLEKKMDEQLASARAALATLEHGIDAAGTTIVRTATAALDDFEQQSKEVVRLSRRNSNVRSLALSLRRKPALEATCDSSLVRLEDALSKRGFSGTR